MMYISQVKQHSAFDMFTDNSTKKTITLFFLIKYSVFEIGFPQDKCVMVDIQESSHFLLL